MAKTIRIKESELRNIIAESVRKIFENLTPGYEAAQELNEIGNTDRGQELLGKAAGRAQKKAQNIGRCNDFDGYCKAMGKADEIGNYARNARIKSTGKAADATGAFTKGVKKGKRVLSEFNSVLPYSNRTSNETIYGTYDIVTNTILTYMPDDLDKNLRNEIIYILDGMSFNVTGNEYSEDATGYGKIDNIQVNERELSNELSEIDALDDYSDEAKEYAKQILTNMVNEIGYNEVNWRTW